MMASKLTAVFAFAMFELRIESREHEAEGGGKGEAL